MTTAHPECPKCLERSLALELLSPYIENARHETNGLKNVLALDNETLARAVGGKRADDLVKRVRGLKGVDAARAGTSAGLTDVCRWDQGFPQRLRDDPTVHAIFIAGDGPRFARLVDQRTPAVAIVGTRRASPEGLRVARELGRGLAAAGITVVSGMALGVDSAAHEGALEGGGSTIAVLGCGADVPYPRSKAALYRRIVAEGAVVSEMPPGATPRKWTFPARNRIIAGLAQATIVVEAAQRSGSLITAEFALELGREVLAVPGSVRSWRSDGTNALIRDGATLVRDARDVLDAVLGPEMAATAQNRGAERLVSAPSGLEPELAELLKHVEDGPKRADDLIAAIGTHSRALAGLAELELLGLIRRIADGRYERCRVG
jgi:DNA processing protein